MLPIVFIVVNLLSCSRRKHANNLVCWTGSMCCRTKFVFLFDFIYGVVINFPSGLYPYFLIHSFILINDFFSVYSCCCFNFFVFVFVCVLLCTYVYKHVYGQVRRVFCAPVWFHRVGVSMTLYFRPRFHCCCLCYFCVCVIVVIAIKLG